MTIKPLPKILESQLKAALLLLETIEEYHRSDLGFTQGCHISTMITEIRWILGNEQPTMTEYRAEQRRLIMDRIDEIAAA